MSKKEDALKPISLKEVTTKRKVSAETLRRAAVAEPQKLRADKIGKTWVTTLKDVDEYLVKYPATPGRRKIGA